MRYLFPLLESFQGIIRDSPLAKCGSGVISIRSIDGSGVHSCGSMAPDVQGSLEMVKWRWRSCMNSGELRGSAKNHHRRSYGGKKSAEERGRRLSAGGVGGL